MSDSKYFTGCGMYRSLPKRKAKKKVSAKKSKNNLNQTKNIVKNKASEENSYSELDVSLNTIKKPTSINSTANIVKEKPANSNKFNRKPKDSSNCSISNIQEKNEVSNIEKAFEEIDDLPLSSLQPSSVNDTKKRKCKKSAIDNPLSQIKKKSILKSGCNCGSGALNPSNLTCCGQRCLCYSKNKACVNCKCKGCRNTNKFNGEKDSAATLPQFDVPPIIDDDPTSFVYNESESGIEAPPESSLLAEKPIEEEIPNSFNEEALPVLEPEPAQISSLEALSVTDQSMMAISPYICPNLLSALVQVAAALPTAISQVPIVEAIANNFKGNSVIEVAHLNPVGSSGNSIEVDNDSNDSVVEVKYEANPLQVKHEANPLQEQSVSSSQAGPMPADLDDSPIYIQTIVPPVKRRKKELEKEPELIEVSDTESTASDVISVYSEGNNQPVPSPLFTEEDMDQLQTMLEEDSVPLPLPYRPPPPPMCRISKQRRRKRDIKTHKSLNLHCVIDPQAAQTICDTSKLPNLSVAEQEAVIQDLQQILSTATEFNT